MTVHIDPAIGNMSPVSLKDLADIECFATMPLPLLEKLSEAAEYRNADAHETLYTVGQYDAFECFALVKGALKVTRVSAATGDMSVEIATAGDIVGLDIVLADQRDVSLSIGIEAEEDTVLIGIESDTLIEAISTSAEALRGLLQHISSRLVEQSFGNVIDRGAEARVFAALFHKVERDPADAAVYIIAEMPKHRELAEIAGVTDVEAAEEVAILLRQGIAKRDYPGLIIEDYDALHKLSI